MNQIFLRSVALVAAFGLAATASAQTSKSQPTYNRDGVQVQTNSAELLGSVTPEVVHIDIHNDPIGEEWRPGDPVREIPRMFWGDPEVYEAGRLAPVNPVPAGVDKLAQLQRDYDASVSPLGRAFTTPVFNFEGAPGTTLPPDPTGDVGADHFVQAVNASGGTRIRVYNKTDGAMVGNYILNAQLGGTGACATGFGDPIVVYDGLADRWVITEFSSSSGRTLCVYVSATNSALSTTWYRYGFQTAGFPDYPKYGVWPNAYFVGANESSVSGQRPFLALERAAMLTGATARFVRVNVPNLAGFGFQMTTPATVSGTDAPPTNAPGIFLRHVDDEAHTPGSNDPTKDYLQVWQFSVDWTPATPTTVLTGPSQIFISEFSSDLNGLSAFNAFPQPNGTKLDPLREPIMNVLMYRNFGSYETLVGNMVTDVDANDTGGVRWFELRRSGGIANAWQLFQEGTYAPADAGGPADRWMAGVGVDSSGNLGLAYSVVRQSPGIFASLRYTGRLNGDPLGVMTTTETELATGERSQTADRWGDYHQMGVDPVDGCTFWFVGEYMGPAGSTNNTRVGAFRHSDCGTPSFTLAPAVTSANICVLAAPVALPPNSISVGSINSYNSPVSLILSTLPTGIAGSFTPPTVATLPSSSILNLTVSPGVAPGVNLVTVQGTSGAIIKTSDISLKVSTLIAAAPALNTPANAAINVPINPTLSWSASTQAASYNVQVASDAAFANVVFSGSVSAGTSIAVTTGLASSTTYYWRVTSQNTCGTSAQSSVFSFTTVPAPGDCSVGTAARNIFTEDFNNGAGGFVTTGGTGASWALSTARPSPVSGGNAMKSAASNSTNQLLTSPAIALPVDQLPLTLGYQRWRFFEINGTAACWDGGFMEVSVNGGAFTPIPGTKLLNDSYTGPLGSGQPAWCSSTAVNYDSTGTLIDLSDWAGSSVQLRWRVSTDSSVTREGWYVDDVRVQVCSSDLIFKDGFDSPTP